MERHKDLSLNLVTNETDTLGFKSITQIHRYIAHPTTIVVNGDICTGSSSLAVELAKAMGMKVFDVGQLIRRATRMLNYGDQWEGLVSDWAKGIWNKTVKRINTPGTIVEGRLVGIQAKDNPSVLKILCTADESVVLARYANRRQAQESSDTQQAVAERRDRDTAILKLGWDKSRLDLLDPKHYDIIVDTSRRSPQVIVEDIRNYLNLSKSLQNHSIE